MRPSLGAIESEAASGGTVAGAVVEAGSLAEGTAVGVAAVGSLVPSVLEIHLRRGLPGMAALASAAKPINSTAAFVNEPRESAKRRRTTSPRAADTAASAVTV